MAETKNQGIDRDKLNQALLEIYDRKDELKPKLMERRWELTLHSSFGHQELIITPLERESWMCIQNESYGPIRTYSYEYWPVKKKDGRLCFNYNGSPEQPQDLADYLINTGASIDRILGKISELEKPLEQPQVA